MSLSSFIFREKLQNSSPHITYEVLVTAAVVIRHRWCPYRECQH